MKNKYLFVAFLIICAVSSCRDMHSHNHEYELYHEMVSHPVKLELDSMLCRIGSRDTVLKSQKTYDYRMVVYADSVECMSCTLSNLALWYDYVKDAQTTTPNLTYIFILTPKQENQDRALQLINKKGLPFPIYIDTLGVFNRTNPHIPQDEKYHVFLLNKQDSVLLIGDIVKNPKVEKLFKKIIK